jgi:hypothetical protein
MTIYPFLKTYSGKQKPAEYPQINWYYVRILPMPGNLNRSTNIQCTSRSGISHCAKYQNATIQNTKAMAHRTA